MHFFLERANARSVRLSHKPGNRPHHHGSLAMYRAQFLRDRRGGTALTQLE